MHVGTHIIGYTYAANLKRKLLGIPLIKLCKNGAKNILKARPID